MTNQPTNPAPKPCHTGEPEEDRVSVREASSVEPALYVLLFIVFFTTLLAVRTFLDVNDSTKTVPDIIHSLVTRHAGNASSGGYRIFDYDDPGMEGLQVDWKSGPQTARRTLYP